MMPVLCSAVMRLKANKALGFCHVSQATEDTEVCESSTSHFDSQDAQDESKNFMKRFTVRTVKLCHLYLLVYLLLYLTAKIQIP